MNSKVISVIVIIVFAGIGLLAWRGYGNAVARIDAQKASIYEATGESLAE